MSKYLVQTFGDEILVTVYEVLKLIEDADYGTIVIVKNNTDEGWEIDCFFLSEALMYNYKFSDDERYKNYINK